MINTLNTACGCFKVTLPRRVSRLNKNEVYSQVASEECRLPEITIWVTKNKNKNLITIVHCCEKHLQQFVKGTKADSYCWSLLKHIMRADGKRFLSQGKVHLI